MSLQRASVNCERCHALASYHERQTNNPQDVRASQIADDRIYKARNEAMRALEDAATSHVNLDDASHSCSTYQYIIRAALTACANCDYSRSTIADKVRENFKSAKSQ